MIDYTKSEQIATVSNGTYIPAYNGVIISYVTGSNNNNKFELKYGDNIIVTNGTGNYAGTKDSLMIFVQGNITYGITVTGSSITVKYYPFISF